MTYPSISINVPVQGQCLVHTEALGALVPTVAQWKSEGWQGILYA